MIQTVRDSVQRSGLNGLTAWVLRTLSAPCPTAIWRTNPSPGDESGVQLEWATDPKEPLITSDCVSMCCGDGLECTHHSFEEKQDKCRTVAHASEVPFSLGTSKQENAIQRQFTPGDDPKSGVGVESNRIGVRP